MSTGAGLEGLPWYGVTVLAAYFATLLVLSVYAVGSSPLALQGLCAGIEGARVEAGELALPEEGGSGRLLPAGFCARAVRGLELG